MARTRIRLCLLNVDNDYQQRLRDDATTAAARAGFDLEVLSARNDAATQMTQITSGLADDTRTTLAAVLVSAVRDDLLADAAATVVGAGVAWGLLNREGDYLHTLADAHPTVPVFSVTADQLEIGRIAGQQIAKVLPAGGAVLCVTGPAKTSSARRRLEGLREKLDGAPYQLSVIEADWTSEGARMAFARWWEAGRGGAPTPNVFAAQNDEMALGVRQALRDAASLANDEKLSHAPVLGCDGSPTFGQRLVKESRLWTTVAVPSAAGPAVICLARHRDKGEFPPRHVILPVTSFPPIKSLKPQGP